MFALVFLPLWVLLCSCAFAFALWCVGAGCRLLARELSGVGARPAAWSPSSLAQVAPPPFSARPSSTGMPAEGVPPSLVERRDKPFAVSASVFVCVFLSIFAVALHYPATTIRKVGRPLLGLAGDMPRSATSASRPVGESISAHAAIGVG